MDNTLFKYFKVIGEINKIIKNASNVDSALKDSLKLVVESTSADDAVLWYADDQEILHPYYSICSLDLSQKSVKPGEGTIGEVYQKEDNKLIIDYASAPVADIDEIFKGVKVSSLICSSVSNTTKKVGVATFIKEDGFFDEEESNILSMITTMIVLQIEETNFDVKWNVGRTVLQLKDIKKSFKNGEFVTNVLKGISMDVHEGEFLVLLGESGCGKSTLLNIIGGMDSPSEGHVIFESREISNASEKELTLFRRKEIGFIFQSYNLMPNLTVKENLDLIADLVENPMDTLHALDLVGLKAKANNYPSQLSGGQQQRVSIARALVKNPKLILADEPTAALDYETSIEVLSCLEEVYKKGTSLVMVTHNEEIAKMANRVIKFRGGKIYESIINPSPCKPTDLVW